MNEATGNTADAASYKSPGASTAKGTKRPRSSAKKSGKQTTIPTPSPQKSYIQLAEELVGEKCSSILILIHPSLSSFFWSNCIVKNPNSTSSIRLMISNTNHNTVDVKKTCEIADNFIGNPLNAGSKHARSFGQDSEVLIISWKKVCCILKGIFVQFVSSKKWVNF